MDRGQARPSRASGDSNRVLRCSIEDAARYLGMSKQDVRIQINTGTLPAEWDGNSWIVLLTGTQLRKDRSTQMIPLDPAALAAVEPATAQVESTPPELQDQQRASPLDQQPGDERLKRHYESLIAAKDEQITALRRRVEAAERDRAALEDRIRTLQHRRYAQSSQTAHGAPARSDWRHWGFRMSQFVIAMLLSLAILGLTDYLVSGDAIPILPELAAAKAALPYSEY